MRVYPDYLKFQGNSEAFFMPPTVFRLAATVLRLFTAGLAVRATLVIRYVDYDNRDTICYTIFRVEVEGVAPSLYGQI